MIHSKIMQNVLKINQILKIREINEELQIK